MARHPARTCAAHRSAPSLFAELADLLENLAKRVSDPYRPELHYMRGPGPKWQAKYAHARAPASTASGAMPPLALLWLKL